MKIAFIGAGKVGAPLAAHLARAGHDVVLAQGRDGSSSVTVAQQRHPRLQARPIAEAVTDAEVVFVCIPYSAVESTVRPLAAALAGKVVVDCTNPVGAGLSHGLHSTTSGSATLQALVPNAHVVKAFTIYGAENFEDPTYPATRSAQRCCFAATTRWRRKRWLR